MTSTDIAHETTRRSTAHTGAALLNLLYCLVGIGLSVPVLFAGEAATSADPDQAPFAIVLVGVVFNIVGLVSSYGVWVRQRWGVVLTLVVNALTFLSGVPGILFGPTAFLKIGSVVGCVVNIVIIYLLLRRRARPAAAL